MQSIHEQYFLFPTAITCVHPPLAPVHGRRNNGTGLTFGSTVIYSCKAGYTLNGSSTVTCMANRQWSGNVPDCSRKLLFHQMYVYQLFGCVHGSPSTYIFLFPFEIVPCTIHFKQCSIACLPSGTDKTTIYISSPVHTDTSVNKLTQRENLFTKAKEVFLKNATHLIAVITCYLTKCICISYLGVSIALLWHIIYCFFHLRSFWYYSLDCTF